MGAVRERVSGLFKGRDDFPVGGAGAATLSLSGALAPTAPAGHKFRERVAALPLFELSVDLGEDIGSLRWCSLFLHKLGSMQPIDILVDLSAEAGNQEL